MRRIYICLHKRNVGRSSDVGKGIALPPMLACLTARKMVLGGRGKTQRGGQNAILVNIAHILQLQHPSPNPCHRQEAFPRLGSAPMSQGRDCHASMTALPTHPFGIVCRHEQVRSWLPSTSPFFALRRVQASTSGAKERRRIHSTFPAMFGLLCPANAAVRAGGWECKTYVCISCQTYTHPSFIAEPTCQDAS